MGIDMLDGDVELTEFVELDVRSVKGVKNGANGFPPLVMKGVAEPAVKAGTHPPFTGTHSHPHAANGAQGEDDTHEHSHSHDGDADHGHSHAEKSLLERFGAATGAINRALNKAVTDGKIDEGPDISLGRQIMSLLGQAIGSEAQEISAGSYGETRDVGMLTRAAELVSCWQAREQAVADGKDPDAPCGCCDWCSGMGCGCCTSCGAGILMCSAAAKAAESAKTQNDLPDSAFAYIEPGGEKDDEGKTTPRSKRHFPVHDEAHARNALARLSSSPFGDKAKARVHAAARKFGIDVSDDTSKSQIAEGDTTVDTETQGTGSLSKAVEDAIAKATAPLQKRIETLDAELAKVKAAPVPGGPVLSRNVQVKQPGGVVNEDYAAKAAYYRDMAEQVTDRTTADGYRKLAREADEKAVKQTG